MKAEESAQFPAGPNEARRQQGDVTQPFGFSGASKGVAYHTQSERSHAGQKVGAVR